MKKISLFLSVLFLPQILAAQNEVGLKDSTVIRAREVKLKEPFLGKAWLSVDGERHDLRGVDYYRNGDGFFKVSTPLGSTYPRTYKLERPGKRIGLYSQEVWVQNTGFGGVPGAYGGQKVKAYFFTKDNGRIEKVNTANLDLALADNPAALAGLKKAKNINTAGIIMTVAGASALLSGAAITGGNFKEENKKPANERKGLSAVSPLVWVGLVFAPGIAYVKGPKERKMREAIAIYNE